LVGVIHFCLPVRVFGGVSVEDADSEISQNRIVAHQKNCRHHDLGLWALVVQLTAYSFTAQVKADNSEDMSKRPQRDRWWSPHGERAAQRCSWKAANIATFVSRDFDRTLIER
jgi:hypothetical protein